MNRVFYLVRLFTETYNTLLLTILIWDKVSDGIDRVIFDYTPR